MTSGYERSLVTRVLLLEAIGNRSSMRDVLACVTQVCVQIAESHDSFSFSAWSGGASFRSAMESLEATKMIAIVPCRDAPRNWMRSRVYLREGADTYIALARERTRSIWPSTV